MKEKKKEHPKIKGRLHPRNRHRERYDFRQLIKSSPELAPYVIINEFQDESIDFSNPDAVKMLNKALLKHYYKIESWDIPDNYLCPPIPGRADYIHYIADYLGNKNKGVIPKGNTIKCLDIGVGANCVYPIIGINEYDWSFIGSDIDPISIASANNIIKLNPSLKGKVEIKLQENSKDYFFGIIKIDDRIDFSICNPPFHATQDEAKKSTNRKLKNLKTKPTGKAVQNFGGQSNELWYDGGEKRFISKMIRESKKFAHSFFCFSTLVSKQTNLKSAYDMLKQVEAVEVKTIPMGQGNKTSRIIVWTFLNWEEQKKWMLERWKNA